MVGIALLVYVKAEHVTYVQDVQGVSIGVGLMGVMGNKGACAVRMQLYDSTLCFVSAHLAAHRGNVQGRNADFANIIDKAQFKEEDVRQAQRRKPQMSYMIVHKKRRWAGELVATVVILWLRGGGQGLETMAARRTAVMVLEHIFPIDIACLLEAHRRVNSAFSITIMSFG